MARRPLCKRKKVGYAKDGRVEISVMSEGKSSHIRTHLFAGLSAPNLIAAAIAVGLHFRATCGACRLNRRSNSSGPHSNRLEILHIDGITVLNDAYNANPDSMESALRTLKEFPGRRPTLRRARRYARTWFHSRTGTSRAWNESRGVQTAPCLFYGRERKSNRFKRQTAASHGPATHSYFAEKEQLPADALRAALRLRRRPALSKARAGMKMEEIN